MIRGRPKALLDSLPYVTYAVSLVGHALFTHEYVLRTDGGVVRSTRNNRADPEAQMSLLTT